MAGTYSIKDLSQLTRIKPHTLRIWEQRYQMMKPERSCTNIRQYSQEDLKYLLNVSLLYDNGFKISNIAKLSATQLNEEVKLVSEKASAFPSQIRAMVIAMIEMDEEKFEKLFSNQVLSHGLEATMVNIVFPFLQHIGILWVTSTINPAQEHFISNLIRQKLVVAIDGLSNQPKKDHKKFILFLPEGELHEIGLLFSAFLVKARGHKVIYLGQSLPLADLVAVQHHTQSDVLLTIITSSPYREEVGTYLSKLVSAIPDTKIWISGQQIVSQALNCPPCISFVPNVGAFIAKIDTM